MGRLPGKLTPACVIAFLLLVGVAVPASPQASFRFALLGDRTGETIPGVFKEALRAAADQKPAFFLTVGDTIQGGNDQTALAEWRQIDTLLSPYRTFKFYFSPGNHDVWSQKSAALYQQFTRHPLHYSFDYKQAHFIVLNDSMSDDLPAGEMAFLESDLQAHPNVRVKFVICHRPSWIFQAVMGNPNFPFHQLVKKYGVKYVIAGHIHQMLHFELDGITYLSIASSGGHLRNDKTYEHGWFFQHTLVTVGPASADFKIEELAAPFGKGRVSRPSDWGSAGLLSASTK